MPTLCFRLIIPRCNNDERNGYYYCSLSTEEGNLRTFLLEESFRDSYSNSSNAHIFRVSAPNKIERANNFPDKFDKFIVITSNNFFSFSPTCLNSSEEFVRNVISNFSLNQLPDKKPLILGFDVLNSRISFNPYNGIDAIVGALRVNNNEFQYLTSIWEC